MKITDATIVQLKVLHRIDDAGRGGGLGPMLQRCLQDLMVHLLKESRLLEAKKSGPGAVSCITAGHC